MDERTEEEATDERVEEEDTDLYTLVDEDGNEVEFEMLASAELHGVMYYAMAPLENETPPPPGEKLKDLPDDEECLEYVILKESKDESGEPLFVTIDDDEEFDSAADFFDDLLAGQTDYDEQPPEDDPKGS